jgi:uncharacterized protein (DUF1499 family)
MLRKALTRIGVFLLAVGILTPIMFSLFSRKPDNLGVTDGKLAPCPASPNCVCTQVTDEQHRIEPLRFDGTAEDALTRLKAVLAAMPRTRIVSEKDDYLHAECTSQIFRFVDDVEFLLDREGKSIHFRSASRVGYSDLGVNRKRMETIRQAFNANK